MKRWLPILMLMALSAATRAQAADVICATHPAPAGQAGIRVTADPGDYTIQTATNLKARWTNETQLSIGAGGSNDTSFPFLGRSPLYIRALGYSSFTGDLNSVQFWTQGSVFSPEIATDDGLLESFLWTWTDNTTSSDHPEATKDFGSAAHRIQHLSVQPAAALAAINLGFDASDGGEPTPLSNRDPQDVSAVYFPVPLTGLRYFAASFNPLTNTLDFAGCTNLEAVECFETITLQHVVLTNLPALRRVCLEDADLQELDLSGNPALEDLRGALNAYTEIIVDRGTGPNLWHWCTRDNPQLTQSFQGLMTNFFAIRELFIWNDNQSGLLAPVSTNLMYLQAADNHYTSADLTGKSTLIECNLSGNQLTNLVLDGCTALQTLDIDGNRLGAVPLDAILSPVSTNLLYLQAADNHYTSADLTGKSTLIECNLSGNQLTNLVLDGCTDLQTLDAHDNRLGTAQLDAILEFLDNPALPLYSIDLYQNAAPPSEEGFIHYSNIFPRVEGRIYVDWPQTSDGRTNAFGGSDAITFVTTSEHPHMEVQTANGSPTNLLWHWGDGRVDLGVGLADHDFGVEGTYTNYVEVQPPGCVTYFGASTTDQGIQAVYNPSNFPALNFLYLYQQVLTELSLAGCANLTQLHLAGNPVSTAVCDQWFSDLDAAVPGPVTNADFYYPATARTSASDAAWSNLVTKGYAMHPL